MPSGPKKRLRARRKKQDSLATDANSDRETEILSISESIDVEDTESVLGTPGKLSARTTYLDKDTVSSQTDEWVRVSDFDVQEQETLVEDVEIRRVRRSLDKLAEWETVSEENLTERQEGSTNSFEEEPSEVEVASGLSSESYTHLLSPHPDTAGNKDGDCFDSDRFYRSNSTSSSSYSSAAQLPTLADSIHNSSREVAKEISSSAVFHPALADGYEETGGSNNEPEEKLLHEIAASDVSLLDEAGTTFTSADTIPPSAERSGTIATDGALVSHDPDRHLEEFYQEYDDLAASSSVQGMMVSSPAEENVTRTVTAEYRGKVNSRRYIPVTEETLRQEKDVLAIAAESSAQKQVPGEDVTLCISLAKETNDNDETNSFSMEEEIEREEKVSTLRRRDSAGVTAKDNQVASTSAEANDEDGKGPHWKAATQLENRYFYPEEPVAQSSMVKKLPASWSSEPALLVQERHSSMPSMPTKKNGIAKEKPHEEVKSVPGCCGVVYWLLGRDH